MKIVTGARFGSPFISFVKYVNDDGGGDRRWNSKLGVYGESKCWEPLFYDDLSFGHVP